MPIHLPASRGGRPRSGSERGRVGRLKLLSAFTSPATRGGLPGSRSERGRVGRLEFRTHRNEDCVHHSVHRFVDLLNRNADYLITAPM
jgi:hypothetical protein